MALGAHGDDRRRKISIARWTGRDGSITACQRCLVKNKQTFWSLGGVNDGRGAGFVRGGSRCGRAGGVPLDDETPWWHHGDGVGGRRLFFWDSESELVTGYLL